MGVERATLQRTVHRIPNLRHSDERKADLDRVGVAEGDGGALRDVNGRTHGQRAPLVVRVGRVGGAVVGQQKRLVVEGAHPVTDLECVDLPRRASNVKPRPRFYCSIFTNKACLESRPHLEDAAHAVDLVLGELL